MGTVTEGKVDLDIDLGKEPVCSACKKTPVAWKVICTCPNCGTQEELSCQRCKDDVDRLAGKDGKAAPEGKVWTVMARCRKCRDVVTLRWERV